MRIAITSRYLPSDSKMGVGYQVHELANRLVDRGHVVRVFSESPAPEGAKYEHCFYGVTGSFRSLRSSWRLRTAVDWSEFDVLHAHGDDWFLWKHEVPMHVRTMHGSCLCEARHITGLKNRLYMVWLAGLESLSCCVADQVVAVSRNTCRVYPWIKQQIPNGVDVSHFHPGVKSAHPTILFVGTFHNRKRGKWLMDVFQSQIRPRIPDAQLRMVCEAPSAEGVEVLGRVDAETLARLYRESWVFCLPSTYEGFGIPYIEAMASGTPVVATPNVGAVDVLDGGRYGSLVEDHLLGSEITRLLLDPGRRDQLAKLGRARALSFCWDAVIREYEVLYRRGVSSAPAVLPQMECK